VGSAAGPGSRSGKDAQDLPVRQPGALPALEAKCSGSGRMGAGTVALGDSERERRPTIHSKGDPSFAKLPPSSRTAGLRRTGRRAGRVRARAVRRIGRGATRRGGPFGEFDFGFDFGTQTGVVGHFVGSDAFAPMTRQPSLTPPSPPPSPRPHSGPHP
jgi:hypothetical protein